jgi:predicted small lipoprotein YifL
VKARWVIALAVMSASLSACGVLSGSRAQPDAQTSAVARTQTTHELPAAPRPAQTVTGPGAATPERAVQLFTNAYINWTADTVGRDMSRLAAASIGQARSALQLAAAQTAGDYELKRGGIANTGTVEAISPLPASRDHYIVVTREQTTATADAAYQGLRPAWHVAIATVARVRGGGWVLSGWQPES